MAKVQILDSGHVDRNDSAFPTLVRLDDGTLVCGFSVGGGPNATGDTQWAISRDQGKTWTHRGKVLPSSNGTTSHLRLSKASDNQLLAYGERNYPARKRGEDFHHDNEPVFCTMDWRQQIWSAPRVIPVSLGDPLEISNPIVVTATGKWLAPGATIPNLHRYGEKAIAMESTDQGQSWRMRTIFEHPEHEMGFVEQKVISLDAGHLLAVAWIMRFSDGVDLDNHFTISTDDGVTWSSLRSTGIHGQTMTPTWLGDDRLLVLYNRRYGSQGVQASLVRFSPDRWDIEFDETLWNAGKSRPRQGRSDSTEELQAFEFGLPSAMHLGNGEFLAVHWCKEEGAYGIRWTRFRIAK